MKYSRGSSRSYGRFHRRVFVCVGFFCVFLAANAYRALDLQFINPQKAKNHARKQQIGYLQLKSKRGDIFDSSGSLLASSKPSRSFSANPLRIEDHEAFAKTVSEISGLRYEFVLSRAAKKKRSFVWIRRKVPDEIADKLEAADIKGLSVIREQKRVYPQGHLLGPVLGFTDTDLRGIEGIEYSLNRYLTGRNTKIAVKKDGRKGSMLFHAPNLRERTKGADVFLTIDSNVQYIVEDELRNGVERFGAKSASAVLIDPHTGRIIAMASYPFFDSNNFSSYSQVQARNLPVWHAFEPGSIMKPFLVAAALEEGFVEPETVFDCENGKFKIGDRQIRDTSPHGNLSVTDTVVFSSNICSYKIGKAMGAGVYHEYLKAFGFGSRSGTVIPGEHRGFIPPSRQWGKLGLATISFGQGISVNALQMVAAVSAIANGGYLMTPYIVDKIVDSSGNLVFTKTPKVRNRVLSYDVSRRAAEIMKQAVERGTGRRARVRSYGVAGKTGTAQVADPAGKGYLKNTYIVSFVGFAPFENPKMALIVVVNRPWKKKYGSQVAAPIFSAIAKRTLGMLETRGLPGDRVADRQFAIPDLRGKSVRDVALWAGESGVRLKISGHGFAVKQSPEAGTVIKKGDRCEVSFEEGKI